MMIIHIYIYIHMIIQCSVSVHAYVQLYVAKVAAEIDRLKSHFKSTITCRRLQICKKTCFRRISKEPHVTRRHRKRGPNWELNLDKWYMQKKRKSVKNMWVAPFSSSAHHVQTATALLVCPFGFLVLKWRRFKSKHLPVFHCPSCRWLSSHVSQAYQQNLRKTQILPAI